MSRIGADDVGRTYWFDFEVRPGLQGVLLLADVAHVVDGYMSSETPRGGTRTATIIEVEHGGLSHGVVGVDVRDEETGEIHRLDLRGFKLKRSEGWWLRFGIDGDALAFFVQGDDEDVDETKFACFRPDCARCRRGEHDIDDADALRRVDAHFRREKNSAQLELRAGKSRQDLGEGPSSLPQEGSPDQG